jgi:hypothetical protein
VDWVCACDDKKADMKIMKGMKDMKKESGVFFMSFTSFTPFMSFLWCFRKLLVGRGFKRAGPEGPAYVSQRS